MRVLLFVTAFVVAVLPATASAQMPAVLPPVDHEQTVSVSLLGAVMQWYNAEYERKMGPAATFGISGSFLDLFEGSFRRAMVFARVYPQGAALSGVYIGGRAGVAWPYQEEQASFAVGLEIGRTWLLGSKKNVAISTGLGFDRILGSEFGDVVPHVRLFNVGIAF